MADLLAEQANSPEVEEDEAATVDPDEQAMDVHRLRRRRALRQFVPGPTDAEIRRKILAALREERAEDGNLDIDQDRATARRELLVDAVCTKQAGGDPFDFQDLGAMRDIRALHKRRDRRHWQRMRRPTTESQAHRVSQHGQHGRASRPGSAPTRGSRRSASRASPSSSDSSDGSSSDADGESDSVAVSDREGRR